jgi:hypothetical protein
VIKNSRGNALLNAIIVAGIVAGIAGIVMTQTQTTNQASRAPRIRAAMAVMQSRVQALANQYTSYTCTTTMDTSLANCSVNAAAFWGPDNQLMRDPVVGAVCPASTPNCGVHLTTVKFSSSSMLFTAQIVYEGTEVPIAPINISMKIPTDILASEMQYVCPLSKPIFQGYDSNGGIECNAFPQTCSNGLSLTTQGVYIAKLDPKSLAPVCNQLGDGTTTKCSSAEYLSSYSWATGSFSSICAPRPNPFTAYPYTQPAPTAASYVITGQTFSSTTSSTTPSPTTTLPSLAFGSCFVAGTQVSMADGSLKRIEDVQVGDQILTYDETLDRQTISPVIEVFHHPSKVSDLYTFTFSDRTRVTSNGIHLYYLPEYHEYAAASEIARQWSRGRALRLLNAKNEIVTVVGVKQATKDVKLYNLHVTSIYDHDGETAHFGHNYYANGVLVHNLKCWHGCNNEAFGAQCCTDAGGVVTITGASNNMTAHCAIDPGLYSTVNTCVSQGLALWPDADCPGSPHCDAGCEEPCSGLPEWYGVGLPPTTTMPHASPPCPYCSSGAGWCGNPPSCSICVVALPSWCTDPSL